MPELADVEGFRRVLDTYAKNSTISDIDVADSQVLRGFSVDRLRKVLCGNKFGDSYRYGKWLIVPLDDADGRQPLELMIHFGMTGSLEWSGGGEQRHKHDRVTFVLTTGELRYRDMRKLKGFYLADDDRRAELLADLGPDARTISIEEFTDRLTANSRQLKLALSDQAVLAGLGNLLADEILWHAKFNPRRRTRDLTSKDLRHLHGKMATVLGQSIKAGQVPAWPSWLTGHRDAPDGECPRCGTTLSATRIGGRPAIWCPHCQQQ